MITAKTLYDYNHHDKVFEHKKIWEQIGESVFYPANHIFIEESQPVEYCYYVKKGRVIAFHLYPNGDERIFELHDSGDLFLENSLLFHYCSPVSYKTTCATEVIRVNKRKMKGAIKEDPEFALYIMNYTSEKYYSTMNRLRNITTQSVAWKVCDFFLTFANKYGIPYKGKILIHEKISQQFISSYIGVNRITVVRMVKELKGMNLIDKIGRFYYICDMKGLKEYQRIIDKEF